MVKRESNSAPLPAPVADRIRELIDEEGEPAVLAKLHISRPTLGRACGRLPLTLATRYMLEKRMAELDHA